MFGRTEIAPGIERIQFNSFDEWLNARHGIGGSDASAVLGMSPYKTNVELWEEKCNIRTPDDISDKEYVKYGHDAEPLIRSLFALDHPEYKVDYYDNNMVRNEKYPWAHASLDGELTDQCGRKGILEIKTTNILNPIQRQKWDGRIPDNYYIQVLHYLLVTEYDFVDLRAQLKSKWKSEIRLSTLDYHIERNDVMEDIEMLKEREEEFWQKILKRQRPYLILPEV